MLRRVATILGYLLLSSLVVLVTFGLVEYGRGYSYNFHEHRIVHTGIVIIQSSPGGLLVAEGDHKAKKKTTYRQSFEAGSYMFTIAKEGYHTWQKTLGVLAGDVTLVQYALLVPNNLHAHTALMTPAITTESLSHDHRHLAYITAGANPGVYVYDIGSGSANRVYSPVAATATAPAEGLVSVQWSDDASHLLVGTNLGGVATMRVMTASGGNEIDLTTQYGFAFAGLEFSGSNWKQLYWISPDGLRRVDLDSQTVSDVLAAHVKQFSIQTDRVLFVQTTTLGDSLWSLDTHSHQQELVPALATSDSYGLAYTSFRGTPVLGVVPSSTGVGTLYMNILSDNSVAQILAHGVTTVSFSPDSHLATFSGPSNITTYDLDQSSVFGSTVSYTFAVNSLAGNVSWFDNFHLLTAQNGRLVWSEFDGANSVDLGPLAAGTQAFGSSDTKSVYDFEATGTQTGLVDLLIKQ